MMPDFDCRVAKLEERADNHECVCQEIKSDLEEIKNTLQSQRGFVRGVVFTVTAIVSGIGLLFNWFHSNGG